MHSKANVVIAGALLALLFLPVFSGYSHAWGVGGSQDPVNISRPQISGAPQTGQTLSCTPGTWDQSTYTYAYQWSLNGTSIAGATLTTYVVTATDVAQQITCTVTATNSIGDFILGQASATSDAVIPTSAGAVPSGGGAPSKLPAGSSVIRFPSVKGSCFSKRRFTMHIRQLAGVTYSSARVLVNGKRVVVLRGKKLSAPVDLRSLPAGKFKVKITVATTDGRKLTGARKYRTCSRRHNRPKPHHL